MAYGIPLSQHLRMVERSSPGQTEELLPLILQMAYAAKVLSREINRAALVGQLGLVGERNVTGDAQTKLDVFGNDCVVDAFSRSTHLAGLVSEEMPGVMRVSSGQQAKYICCVDPVDGSSNIDINNAIGTIFGFYRLRQNHSSDLEAELLRPDTRLVCGGYVMYGTSTMLVYSQGLGVYGFTLDRGIGEFILSNDVIHCPEKGHQYSANVGRRDDWPEAINRYIDYVNARDRATGRPYSMRYSGAMVADIHRILCKGGLFFYPPDAAHPDGKLRLLYECAPLGFIVEQAGGLAATGVDRVLELSPTHIHQQVPLVIGSRDEVRLFQRFLRGDMPQ
jgi:fructose-1,6-bisphosphatase I